MRYLTKSAFTLGYTCPQKLFYESHREVYVKQDKSMDALRIEAGHKIGELAKVLFAQADEGNAYEITTRDQQQQISETKQRLSEDHVTVFEPTITHENHLVRVDVLRKSGNDVQLIEVKSKTFDPSENPDLKTKEYRLYRPYVLDLAFQYWVLKQAHPDWNIQCFLMLVDKTKPAQHDGLHAIFPSGNSHDQSNATPAWQGLSVGEVLDDTFLKLIPADALVKAELEQAHSIPGFTGSFDEVVAHLSGRYCDQTPLKSAPIGAHCKDCHFYAEQTNGHEKSGFHACWAQAFDGEPDFTFRETLFGLFHPASSGKRSTKGLFDSGCRWLKDIDPDALDLPEILDAPLERTHRQRMQLTRQWPARCDHNNDYYFDGESFTSQLHQAIETTQWPLFFLDFEGATSPLPFRAGQRPNHTHLFQYSLHIMHESGELQHFREYIDLSNDSDVNVEMLNDLKEALGDQGTIFRWSDYENTKLNEIRSQLMERGQASNQHQELIAFIESITQRKENNKWVHFGDRNMVDQKVWADKFYFHPQTHGSSSIKALLPAMMASSSFLKSTYSKPIYGTKDMKSHNFDQKTWWVPGDDGRPYDPYDLLVVEETVVGQDLASMSDLYHRYESIKEGAAASAAYMNCFSGTLSDDEKQRIRSQLLKYCELDTLAMVMIMQAWLADAGIELA